MSHLSQVIVIVFPPSNMTDLFDRINAVLWNNNFEFEKEPFDSVILSDIETDDGEDYIYESESIYPESKQERDEAIARLRTHRTGGLVNYRGVKEKFEGLEPYDVGIEFCSLDNTTIEYISITARDYIFEPHAIAFEGIITSVLDSMDVIGVAKGLDYPYEWSEEEVAELIKKGELETVYPRLSYKRSEV